MDGNTRAISIFTTYLLINILLTVLILRDIYSTLLLSKNGVQIRKQTTISKISSHIFLAILCLGVTWYYMISFFSLSYKSWAFDNHVRLPQDIYAVINDPSTVKLGLWLKDVQLFRDAWEVVVETPGRLCWSQPIFFITAGWSFFIAAQAHSRNIAHAWAYMVLGQLVAISFAMNLFFIAVCAYQVAEPPANKESTSSNRTTKDHARQFWTPHPALYLLITTVTIGSVMAVPGATGTPYFLQILAVSHVLLLLPPLACKVMPKFMRVDHDRTAYNNVHWLQFWIIFLAFGAIQSYTIWQASQDETVDRHLHRHSNVYIRSPLVSKSWLPSQLVPLMDHPAVSSVGWDSILCTASIAVWISHR